MIDDTQKLLLQSITTPIDKLSPELFIADENMAEDVLREIAQKIPVITNRFNLFRAIQHSGSQHQFSDFDLSQIAAASLQRIYYRTSKEKAAVHFIINAATRLLKPQGELVLAGEKQQGIQTYIKKAEATLNSMALVKKDGPTRIGIIKKNKIGALLDDSDYTRLRPAIQANELIFYSKPGVFGWDKLDQGSAFLVNYLDRLPIKNSRLLDLGCGYGYLSVMAHQHAPELIHATDNNAAALLACKKNFEQFKINGDVIADNIGASLTPGYDVILCNPPFHKGFDVTHGMTDQFLAASARLLEKSGQALFVVNGFIALEKLAANYFKNIETIADNRKFKVILLAAKKIGKKEKENANERK